MPPSDPDDSSQLQIPGSFLALYLRPGGVRPTASRHDIAARYEHCEDLATALVELADTQRWSLGIHEEAVLERVWRGLAAGQAGVTSAEARWVSLRLAELLGWAPWHPPDGEQAAGTSV